MELGKAEQLAICQALYKLLGEIVDTKNPDSLRFQVDEFYKRRYEETGAKGYDIKLGDDVIATYSCRFSKEEPQETRYQMEVRDYVKLAQWYSQVPEEYVRQYLSRDLQPFAEYYFHETGELPDGCVMDEIVILAKPKQYIGGVLRVNSDAIMKHIGNELPAGVAGLLGESHE